MPNNANIAALKAILSSIDLRINDGQSLEMWASDIAFQLAERGALVPAALTDDECHDVLDASYRAADTDGEPSVRPSRFRQALAALAQGKPVPSWPPTEV